MSSVYVGVDCSEPADELAKQGRDKPSETSTVEKTDIWALISKEDCNEPGILQGKYPQFPCFEANIH